MEGLPFSQLSSVFVSTLLLVVYLLKVKPFKAKSDNFVNVLNALFLLSLYIVGFLLASSQFDSSSLGICLLLGIFSINVANVVIILVFKFRSCCCPRTS